MKRMACGLLLALTVCQALADDLADKIKARITQAEIIQGHFYQQKTLQFLSKPLLAEGEFLFQQRKGILWKTLKPIESTLLIGRHQLISRQGEQAIPTSIGRLFPVMLSGDFSELSADFTLSGTIDTTGWQLTLRPVDSTLANVISQISLRGDQSLQSVEISESNGNRTEIRFEQVNYPPQLSSEQAAQLEPLSP